MKNTSTKQQRKNRVWETMTCFFIRSTSARLRVWTTSKKFALGPEQRLVAQFFFLVKPLWELDGRMQKLAKNHKKFAKYLLKIAEEALGEDLAAIEYTDFDGNGVVLYPDWK